MTSDHGSCHAFLMFPSLLLEFETSAVTQPWLSPSFLVSVTSSVKATAGWITASQEVGRTIMSS